MIYFNMLSVPQEWADKITGVGRQNRQDTSTNSITVSQAKENTHAKMPKCE